MVIVFGVEVVFARFITVWGVIRVESSLTNGTPEPEFERIKRVVTTFSRGAARCFLAVTIELNSHPGEVPLLTRRHLFMDFAGVRAMMTAGRNGAIIRERDQGELLALLDYRKDVISNQRNEQHLFTKRPKH